MAGDGLTVPTVVYFCCEDGVLRYIGITSDFPQRRRDHRRHSWWWTPETEMRVVRSFDDRRDAIDEERKLIEELCPPFNIVHNHPDAARRRPDWVQVKTVIAPAPITGPAAVMAAKAASLHQGAHVADARRDAAVARRDALVRELRAEDPGKWSYRELAAAVGCSESLIAAIVKGRTGRKRGT